MIPDLSDESGDELTDEGEMPNEARADRCG